MRSDAGYFLNIRRIVNKCFAKEEPCKRNEFGKEKTGRYSGFA